MRHCCDIRLELNIPAIQASSVYAKVGESTCAMGAACGTGGGGNDMLAAAT